MENRIPDQKQSLTAEQELSRLEWRHLCETLERAQGEELARQCHDKFAYVKTYQIYGEGMDLRIAEIKKAAAQGNYQFFLDRGVPAKVLTPAFAEVLLNDWKVSVRAKKDQVAEVFNLRFHEDIRHCIETYEEEQKLNSAVPLHQRDGFLQLTGMAQPGVSSHDIDQLRLEIAEIREQLIHLHNLVHSQLKTDG
ncbi:MAG: hypothetical protein JW829_16500 [Pirellulales bacterium]|nr:hypothetical protein [Pirellulales bacterium]